MTTEFSEYVNISPDEFKQVNDVPYMGYVYGTMAALKRMTPRNKGVIVQVGSALAYRSIPLQSAYCGAKHAIKGFTDSIRSELMYRKSNVWITMVHLPAVNTPQFDWCKNKMQYNGPPDPQQPNNLFKPVEKNAGARGNFSSRAKEKSYQEQFIKWPLYPSYGAILFGAFLWWLQKRNSKK